MIQVTKSELRDMYEDRGKTVAEIATHYGVHTVTIYDWLKRFGIPVTRAPQTRKLVDDESGGTE